MHGGKVIETAQTIPALDQEPGPLVVLGAVSLGEEVEVVLGIGPGLGHRDVVKMALGLAQKLVPMTETTEDRAAVLRRLAAYPDHPGAQRDPEGRFPGHDFAAAPGRLLNQSSRLAWKTGVSC